jgi:hypothetical protein
MKAQNDTDFMRENERMVRDVCYFDLLRSDKSISGAGLEARVPFADKKFLQYVMSIPPRYKMFNDERIEKYIFRKAFSGLLPDDILWRRKEAFSDGVSGHERSWFQIIRDYIDTKVTDEEYEKYKELVLVYLVEKVGDVKQQIDLLGFTPAIYSPYFEKVTSATVDQCHKMGMKIIPWTVNDTEQMKKLKLLGVDGIITDYPDRIPGNQ